jgi:hypothetical protein
MKTLRQLHPIRPLRRALLLVLGAATLIGPSIAQTAPAAKVECELDTARRCKLPVLTVILNNASWGVIRMGQRQALDFQFGTAELPAAFERANAARAARAAGQPAVLDCRTRFVPHPAAPAFGRMNCFGHGM